MTGGFEAMRERMVREQIEARGIWSPLVLTAMRSVPRHLFVDPSLPAISATENPR